MGDFFYFDHAATTAMDNRVFNEMVPFFTDEYGNASSLYSLGRNAKEAINVARIRVASSINCNANEIYFNKWRNRK